VRFVVLPPDNVTFQGAMALSPDGKHLAVVTVDDKRRTQLWLRSMGSEVALRVGGADGATFPFWSPEPTAGSSPRWLKIMSKIAHRLPSHSTRPPH
jgi:hypothetical protein